MNAGEYLPNLSFFLNLIFQFLISFPTYCYDSYPAMRPEVVSIAAVSKQDNLPVAYFSNGNDEVDYSGIGVGVYSFLPGGGFQQMSGK